MEGQSNLGFENGEQRKTSQTSVGGGGFLSVEGSDINSHTYVYEADKSLRRMTVEALPSEDNYKNLADIGEYRPTLEELMVGEKKSKVEAQPEDVEVKKGKVIKFGWVEGVLMRCLLNIWGTMLFLRLTWVVGQSGIVYGLLCITLCNVVTAVSAVSMSAISTNGQIAGGGVYYMISRSLGPALGGSIGLMFTMANTISVATYTIGFAESLLDLLADVIPGWNGIFVTVDECSVAGCRDNDVRIIGGPCLLLFLIIAFAGMDWVTRIQKTLLVLLIFAQIDMFAGSFIDIAFGTCYVDNINEGYQQVTQEQRHAYGYTGWSLETAKENMMDQYVEGPMNSDKTKPADFWQVFGVFFTAVTGIVAGANLSGDLKDPSEAIPKGTLLAIVATYITYTYFAVQTGFIFKPQASGVLIEYQLHGSGSTNQSWIDDNFPQLTESGIFIPRWDNCTKEANAQRDILYDFFKGTLGNDTSAYNSTDYYTQWSKGNPCLHGSAMDQMTMTYTSFTGFLRYAGGFSASLSSAIASLVGAPRVLQAVGKDNIYPGVNFFAFGYTANNDPYRGYILVFVVAFAFTMWAGLNIVSVIASNFFLAAYALMNLSCFHSSITKAPSWRPSYKWYNPWVALAGSFLCIVIMFILDYIWATATLLVLIALGAYLMYANPETNWGSSVQAQVFVDAVKSVHVLTETPDHVKTYRPKILCLTGNPAHRPALVDFANIITKKTSLLICGHVLNDPAPVNLYKLREDVQFWLKDHAIKGFYTVNQSSSFEEGAKNCITMAGLGKMAPNLVLLGFKANWKSQLEAMSEYINSMYCAFDQKLSFGILRVQDGFDYSSEIVEEQLLVKEVPVQEGDHSDDEQPANPNELALKPKTRKVSTAVYRGAGGLPLENKMLANIQMFKETKAKKTGNIDVWWLYDDGGLTLLLPYIINTRKQYKGCKLRIFSLANRADQLDKETRQMATMLAKFRIDYSDVNVIPDVTKKADASIKAEFDSIVEGCNIDPADLQAEREKTNRHLRLAEMLRKYSSESEMVVMTLPLPRRGQNPALYMAWLDIMTKNLPPTLLVRGNQQSVLTFYS